MCSWRLKACFAVLGAVTLVAAYGCADAHECSKVELCDGVDNDCDTLVDETFVDEEGLYASVEHCGSCGISCDDVIPNSATTECVVTDQIPTCELLSCADGFHPVGRSCVPDLVVLCLTCVTDDDCAGRGADASCEEGRCFPSCADGQACPPSTECSHATDEPRCLPLGGDCDCSENNAGLTVACALRSTAGVECAGARTCAEDGFGECAAALGELCNGADDDCDDIVDEDFRNDDGVYFTEHHCGACGQACVAPGANMMAVCNVTGHAADCDVECVDGFVDVDGVLANGCECERWDGIGPPPVVGGDADCDGVVDDFTDFVYVTSAGSDANPGSLVKPMRTVRAAVLRGADLDRDVLVATGIYDGPLELQAGVSVFGGYRPDFRDRDVELYPVVLESAGGQPGAPVVLCHDIVALTRLEGVTILGSDAAAAGDGSTTVFADGCGAQVTFASLVVAPGRGADGARGIDSSDNLDAWGLDDLDDLRGVDGVSGKAPPNADACPALSGGSGGTKSCPSGNVSGGAGGGAFCPNTGCVNGAPCANAGCTDFTTNGVCDYETVLDLAVPNPAPALGHGAAGGEPGAVTYNSPTDRGECNFCDDNLSLPRFGDGGGDGGNGADGTGGAGCKGVPFVLASGVLRGGDGSGGSAGTDGAGGGGGSAGSGYMVIGGTFGNCDDRSGASGGGGGSGGCGAPMASGGTGGGLSAGFVIRVAGEGPTFDQVRVVTASGGRGGDGGIGANGGAPGVGGTGGHAQFWCARSGGGGGDGGRGGAAGGGGGGCGGGAHAAVILGSSAAYEVEVGATLSVDSAGVAGAGGRGGFSPGAPGANGKKGSATSVLRLP